MNFISEIAEDYDIKICGAVADRDCLALRQAINIHKIPTSTHSFNRTAQDDLELVNTLNNYGANVIVTNVHKILSPLILENVSSLFINLHYSYLPAYEGYIGMRPLAEAIERGNKFAGVTCHLVTEVLDAGTTIAQAVFPIYSKNKNENIQQCFEAGALTLLSGLLYVQRRHSAISHIVYKEILISPGFKILSQEKIESTFNKLKNG